MHSWGFALREGVFAETKEGKCLKQKGKKLALKNSRRARLTGVRPYKVIEASNMHAHLKGFC
jgi:hypothetical protein